MVAEEDRRDGAVTGRESFKMGCCGELVTAKELLTSQIRTEKFPWVW